MIFKGIIAIVFLIQGLRSLYKYDQALTNWSQSKGTIVNWEYSYGYNNSSSYPIVKFPTAEGRDITTKTDFNLPFSHLLYRKGTEIDILYLASAPEQAMVKTVFAPITYSVFIVIGFCIFWEIRF